MINAHEQGLLGKFAEDFAQIKELTHKVERDPTLSDDERAQI